MPRVLNIRPTQQAFELSEALSKRDLTPVAKPMLETRLVSAPEVEALLDRINALDEHSLLVFTSANGVQYFRRACQDNEVIWKKCKQLPVSVIGEKTAEAVTNVGLNLVHTSVDSHSEGLALSLSNYLDSSKLKPAKLVLLRARIASSALPRGLEERGFSVLALPVYESTCPTYADDEALDLALRLTSPHPERIHAVAATSSQAVRNLVTLLERSEAVSEPGWYERFLKVPFAAIGPKTAKTIEKADLNLVVVAEKPSTAALASGLFDYFAAVTNSPT